MRSMKTASLSFGMVNVPCKVYKATEDTKSDLHLFHNDASCLSSKEHGSLRQVKTCATCGEKLTKETQIHGTSVKGSIVTMTDDEIAAIRPEKSAAIEITEFVPTREIETLYFKQHYFLGADKKASTKAFFLMREALRDCGKVAIGTVTFQKREYVCAIQAYKNGFVLSTLNYEDEIRNIGELSIDEPTVSEAELKLARKLIAEHSKEQLDMTQFSDSFSIEMNKMIEAKADGITLEVENVQQVAQTTDANLLTDLEGSLGDVWAKAPIATA